MGLIEGISPKHGCPKIHHLFFVKNSFFFLKGSIDNAITSKEPLSTTTWHQGK